MAADDPYGFQSPGGFVFGVSGWHWGEPRPTSITFFLDGTARVSDQYGRPIKGTVVNNREVRFASGPPSKDDPPGARAAFATHAQVIAALSEERIDWSKLTCAGWPQLPYATLKKLPETLLPPVEIGPDGADSYLAELRKIPDQALRKDAIRLRREQYDILLKETQAAEVE